MTRIQSVTQALPEHEISTAELVAGMEREGFASPDVRSIAERCGVESRRTLGPLSALRGEGPVGFGGEDESRVSRLACAAARKALVAAGLSPAEVGTVISTTSTAQMIPSVEVHVANDLGLAPGCRRVPLANLGCTGGVAALALGTAMLSAAEARPVLVVSVEVPSLHIARGEQSPADVASTLTFGDAAAAAVLGGGDRAGGLSVVATSSTLFGDTTGACQARVTRSGTRLLESSTILRVVRRRLADTVERFLAAQRLAREDIRFWVIPGRSAQMMETIADALALSDADVQPTKALWARRGNTLSAGVLLGLAAQADTTRARGELGLMLSIGAGVSCEMALLRV